MKLPFQKDGELRRSLFAILGFLPGDISLYKQALLHKSAYGRKFHGMKQNNERLEFLGDAVLDAVVGDIVYHHFKGKPEGFLTNTRSKIVQRESLNRIGQQMGIDKLVRSSEAVHNSHNSNLLGNAFEALVGAIYEDRGYEACMQFMKKQILSSLVNIDKVAYKEVNFKSKLLEWSQKNRIRVSFELVAEGKEGSSSPTFETDIIIEGVNCGTGKGYTKKESQQLAAKDALTKLKQQKLQDEVFEAKSRRTAMDEQPTALVPDVPEDAVPVGEGQESRQRRTKKGSANAKREERRAKEQAKAAKEAKEAEANAPKDDAAPSAEPAEAPKRKRRPRKKNASAASEETPSPQSNEVAPSVATSESEANEPTTKAEPKKRQKENSRQRRQRKAREAAEAAEASQEPIATAPAAEPNAQPAPKVSESED